MLVFTCHHLIRDNQVLEDHIGFRPTTFECPIETNHLNVLDNLYKCSINDTASTVDE
jgi:hypothetical protein